MAQRLCPTQSTGDELVDPVDGGLVLCDVGRQSPVACTLAGPEYEPEGGLGPSQEVQEPHGEGLPGSVLPPVSGGVVLGVGLEGVGVGFGASPPHGSLGHGGVGWALLNEARQGSPPQVGDEEVGEVAVVGEEPIGPWGSSGGDGGCGSSGSQDGDVPLQTLDGGLVGLRALEEGAGGDLRNLPKVVGTPSSAKGLQDGEGETGGDASFWEDRTQQVSARGLAVAVWRHGEPRSGSTLMET